MIFNFKVKRIERKFIKRNLKTLRNLRKLSENLGRL